MPCVDVRVLDVVAVQSVQQLVLEFLAEHGGAEAVEDQQHADAAGVHHMGGVERLELVLRAHHGGDGGFHGGVEGHQGVVAVVAVVREVHGGRGAGGSFHHESMVPGTSRSTRTGARSWARFSAAASAGR